MTRLIPWISAAFLISASYLVAQTPGRNSVSSSGRLVDTLPKERAMPADFDAIRQPAIAISPDGRTIVYRAEEGGHFRLYRRSADRSEATPIGDLDASGPFFSSGGQSIGFTTASVLSDGFGGTGAALKRVPVGGGPTQLIASGISSSAGAYWNADGTILIGGGAAAGLRRIAQTGGEPTVIARPAENTSFRYPQMLPGGKTALYTGGLTANGQLMLLDVATGESKPLMSGLAGRYLPSGHLVFAAKKDPNKEDYSLMAVSFDPASGHTHGSPVSVVDSVRVESSGQVQAAIADSGVLAYLPGTITQQRTVVWIDRQGREQSLGLEPRAYATPRVSPDGKQVALTLRGGAGDVYVYDIGTRQLKQLTSDATANYLPAWSPDSKRLAFTAITNPTTQETYWQMADGSDKMHVFETGRPDTVPGGFPAFFLSDGRLLIRTITANGGSIELIPPGGKGTRQTLIEEPAFVRNPVISPDNKWIAFESIRTGRPELYVRPFPNVKDHEYPLTKDGGCCPVWGKDGQLYYWTESGGTVSIVAVSITTSGSSFSSGTPKTVARGVFPKPSWDTPYDVAPDGRILVIKNLLPPPPNQVVVISNWLQELNRLVPTK